MKGAGNVPGCAVRVRPVREGGGAVLEISGRLEAPLHPEMRDEIDRLLDRGRHRIIVDCSGLEYLGSRGVSIFIAVIDEVRARGGDLKLAGVRPQAAVVLDRLGVTRLIQVFRSVDEAVRAFEAPIGDYMGKGGLDVFVGSREGRVFHASRCDRARRIGQAVTYPSKKAAREAGRRPCRRCC